MIIRALNEPMNKKIIQEIDSLNNTYLIKILYCVFITKLMRHELFSQVLIKALMPENIFELLKDH